MTYLAITISFQSLWKSPGCILLGTERIHTPTITFIILFIIKGLIWSKAPDRFSLVKQKRNKQHEIDGPMKIYS
jgi:hypothetical protein